jgi:hypothetical protein
MVVIRGVGAVDVEPNARKNPCDLRFAGVVNRVYPA